MKKSVPKKALLPAPLNDYSGLVGGIGELLESTRRSTARYVNALMTATYWEIGRRIVEFEQRGKGHATYGIELLKSLAEDLTTRYGRGFSVDNLENMRLFYGIWGSKKISETVSRILQSSRGQSSATPFNLADLGRAFPLPWSNYVLLIKRCSSSNDIDFYHTALPKS